MTFGEALPGFNGRSSSNVDWHNESVEAQHCSLDFGFLEAMKIKLLAGRFFLQSCHRILLTLLLLMKLLFGNSDGKTMKLLTIRFLRDSIL